MKARDVVAATVVGLKQMKPHLKRTWGMWGLFTRRESPRPFALAHTIRSICKIAASIEKRKRVKNDPVGIR